MNIFHVLRKHDKLLTFNVSVSNVVGAKKRRAKLFHQENLDGIGRLVLKFKRFASCSVWNVYSICTIVEDFVCHERIRRENKRTISCTIKMNNVQTAPMNEVLSTNRIRLNPFPNHITNFRAFYSDCVSMCEFGSTRLN